MLTCDSSFFASTLVPFWLEAMFHLAKENATGLDGFPAKFFQKYWHIRKQDLIQIIHDFYDNKVDLWRLNKAHITLIPKKLWANRWEDFYHISVISAIPKIITKLLADRLSKVLPYLTSKNQTTFVHERRITETFLLARQSLSFLHKEKISSVLLKVDFKKIFDTI
jgi:Reverse transcriptase (RNA-dependent DNA polymerase)